MWSLQNLLGSKFSCMYNTMHCKHVNAPVHRIFLLYPQDKTVFCESILRIEIVCA